MIEFLQAEVEDRRFEYVHVNVKNGLYNPEGAPFSDEPPSRRSAEVHSI